MYQKPNKALRRTADPRPFLAAGEFNAERLLLEVRIDSFADSSQSC